MPSELPSRRFARLCEWLSHDIGYVFATLVVEEVPGAGWSLAYVFYRDADWPWVYVELQLEARRLSSHP